MFTGDEPQLTQEDLNRLSLKGDEIVREEFLPQGLTVKEEVELLKKKCK